MKKSLIFGMLLITVTISGYSQDMVAEFEHEIPLAGKERFVYTSMEYIPATQNLKILGKTLKIGMVYVSKEGKKTSFASGTDYIPFVYVATLAPDTEATVVEEAIHLNSLPGIDMDGKQYEVQTPPPGFEKISNSETAKPLEELKQKYPGAFHKDPDMNELTMHQLEVASGWKEFYIGHRIQKYTYDEMEDKLSKEDSDFKKYTFDFGKDYKIILEGDIVDNKRQLAIAATMRGVKKDKLAGYKNKRIYVTKGEEITNQFDLEFEYPKSLIFSQGLGRSAQDTTQTFDQGGILIYGRAFGVGKKNNDPDFTRNYVAMLDAQGNLLSQSEFHFGDEKFSLEPYYAFKKGEYTMVFGKTISKDNPGYAVLKFNEGGLVSTESYNTDQIKEMVDGPYDEGITTKYGRGFRPIDHYELSNGETLVYGEAFDTRTESVSTEMANGQMMTEQKTVYEYKSQVFLRFDAEGKVTGLNVLPKEERFQNKLNVLKRINEVNDKLYLIGNEFDDQSREYATIYKIDYASGDVLKTSLKDYDIYEFNGKVVKEFIEDENTIVFLGKMSDTEVYTMKAAVFQLD